MNFTYIVIISGFVPKILWQPGFQVSRYYPTLFPGWGWVGGVLIETKASLTQFQMKLTAGAKLGNTW